MKFHSAAEAFIWAETVISIREGGKTSIAFKEFLGASGICLDYMILDAIQIRKESEEACRRNLPCPYRQPRCLFNAYMPDPLVQTAELSESELKRQDDCKAEFERLLAIKGFLIR